MAIKSKLIAGMLAVSLLGASAAKANTIGSNLVTAPNDSVCKFQAFEPKTQVCTVHQRQLSQGHMAAGGLRVPFDGIVVRWSVVSAPVLPGTGKVTMALRATEGPGYMEKGPEVELPLGAPGTRYTYPERLPVTAGQPLGLRIVIENRSVQEAGAPLAFMDAGIGTTQLWWGEPLQSVGEEEVDTELLLNAEIEPDGDHDGYGDLSQDCFPNHPGDQHLCGLDLAPPVITPRFSKLQDFLRSGVVVVRVSSSESGVARVAGDLQIKGRGGRAYALHGARKSIVAGGQAVLRMRVRRKVLQAARSAAADGKRLVVNGHVGVLDASGNESQAPIRVRSVSPRTPKADSSPGRK